MKFLFLSRHQLTNEQKKDLVSQGFTAFETVNPGVITSADDVIALATEHKADGVGLVAPGRIWAALVRRSNAFAWQTLNEEGDFAFRCMK